MKKQLFYRNFLQQPLNIETNKQKLDKMVGSESILF